MALAVDKTCQANIDCYGTNQVDTLTRSEGQDRIFGLGGPDLIYGMGGDDLWLSGGGGTDAARRDEGDPPSIEQMIRATRAVSRYVHGHWLTGVEDDQIPQGQGLLVRATRAPEDDQSEANARS